MRECVQKGERMYVRDKESERDKDRLIKKKNAKLTMRGAIREIRPVNI